MADLVKLKTGKIDKLASVDENNNPTVPLEAGNVYFAVDTTTHKGKIVYDAPNGTSVDRIVMSTDAERADSADKALTADKAVTLVAARNIDGINFNGGANVIHYTTCVTNASKVEKVVTINGFALISGARISVRFANTNSADSPTLNVSGTGAKPILYNGTNIPTAYLTNNKVWDFIYDGDLDAWIFVGDKNIDTNTTYTEATATKSGLMSASDKTKLDTIQSGAKVVNYESHLASGVKVGTITIGGTATDIFSTPDTWTAFKGATADAAGSAGYIGNAPAAGEQNAFFTGAGTWKTLTVADDKNNGLMSSDDRTKLDSIESNANYTYLNASAPISVNKHVGTITISHNASGATAGTYGTNSSTALTPGFGESFSVTGFQINATGHVISASNHNVKMPDTLVDDTHRGLMSSDMYLAWNKGITLAGHQLLLGSAWSKTDFLDTLGLTNALRWIGNATVAIADGSKTDPKVTGYDFSKAKPGDVVLDKDNKREYAWTLAGAWESLGPDGDLATADHRHANATSTTDGFMSADDKAKLDTVESKANYIYVSANAPISVNKHVGALTITHNTSGVTAGAYGDAVAQAPGFGASFLVPNLTVNATGHVTVAGAHTVTIPNALVTDKTNGLMSADDKARFDIIKDGYYVKRAGDTMTGDLFFSDVGTGVRQIRFIAGGNDYGRFAVGATDPNAGYVEIASADGGNEPIYVRQYTGTFATIKRTLTLLDASGNTILPGTLTAAGATINGATTINSTLHTTGATTLDSTLSVGGTATMKGALNVNGAATIGSNLTVAGTSTLNGPLVTNGTVTFNNGFFNYAGIGLAEGDAFRNVWFSEATHRGQPVYNDNFVYNPHTAQLWIKSTADASSTTKTGALIIGADNGDQIAIDNNEILARVKSTAGTLFLQDEGGRIETRAIIYNGNGTDATSTTTGSIQTVGGVGIGKQLRVGGATNLGGSLTVASGTSIGGALSVGGNTTLNNNLTVSKAAIFNGGVTFTHKDFNYSGIESANAAGYRHVWFSDITTNGKPCYNDGIMYNPRAGLKVTDWVRTTGATGWYSETYGGGWYMSDSTWIRIWGGKNIYAGTQIIRTDGQLQVGDNGNKFKVDASGNETLAGTLDASNYRMVGGSNPQDANNVTTTGLWYYSSGGPSTSLGASTTDGALYTEAYSSSWQGQIAQDYRNGNLFVRGKNNGTWTDWKRALTSTSQSVGSADQIVYFNNGNATGGTSASISATKNTIVKRDNNNYVYLNYINTNIGIDNSPSASSSFLYTNSDGWIRKADRTHFATALGFNWSGQGGQPTWLWGGNTQGTYYVYNPSNFNVATARTAYSLARVQVESGNTDNYFYHRFAYVQNITWVHNDTDSIFLIRQKYNGGNWGIIKCSMRTNGSNSPDVNLSCTWLARYGFAADSIQFGRWGATGDACYADLFVKAYYYARMEVINLSDAAQWTMCSSNEVDDTTPSDRKNSSNCYSSLSDAATQLHGKAYTATGVASDGGIVDYANRAGSVSWNNIKEKTNATSSAAGLMSASDKVSLDNAMPRSGGSFTGDVSSNHEISDRYGKMIVSREVNCKNVSALIENVRYTNGCCGSVSFTDAEFIAGVTINATWFNYIWVPHRTGAENGQAKADNCNYGTLYLTSMTQSVTSAIIRYASGSIQQIRLLDSITKSFTLSASSWSSGSYTISDSLITASSNQEVLPATTITAAQYNALSKAQIIDGGQSAGKLTLKALGTVPTIDIPIRIIFRGTI